MSKLESVEKRRAPTFPNGDGSILSFYFDDGTDVHCEFNDGEDKSRTIATLEGTLKLLRKETSP